MKIVKIAPLENGAHSNLDGDHITSIPYGWAMIPDNFLIPESFPFVDIEAEEQEHTHEIETDDGKRKPVSIKMMTVIGMKPRPIPEEPEPEPTADEDTSAMLIDHEFRLTMLELGLTDY